MNDSLRSTTAIVIWQETMRIGIKVLDDQRRDFAELLSLLDTDPDNSISSEFWSGKFSVWQVAMSEYFSREESYLGEIAYPKELLDQHIHEHTRLLSLFNDIYLESMKTRKRTAHEVFLNLKSELKEHFLSTDLLIRDFVNGKSIG